MRSRALASVLLVAVAIVAAAAPVRAAGAPARTRARPAAPKQVLPWIEDDYTRAVAQAKARKIPIFVESWAPW